MAQVKGRLRWLTMRLSSERDASVKYSTLWPSRTDSPSAAMRAMPISLGAESGGGSKSAMNGSEGREVIGMNEYQGCIRYLFAHNMGRSGICQARGQLPISCRSERPRISQRAQRKASSVTQDVI